MSFIYRAGSEMPEDVNHVVVDHSVTSIDQAAFCAETLATIHLPETVTCIGDYAFSFCRSLETIHLPNSVSDIGYGAFSSCNSLTSIHLPDSITRIGKRVFSGCQSLSSIDLPDSVTHIGCASFIECINLTSIKLPSSVTTIQIDAFNNCSNLTSIEVPRSVTTLAIREAQGTTRPTRSIRENVINENIGSLVEVLENSSNLSLVSQRLADFLELGRHHEPCPILAVFVNWKICARMKDKRGRLPLFSAVEKGLRWFKEIDQILEAYMPALEERDVVTGLDPFMLAAVGLNSDVEAVYHLLLENPAACRDFL